MLRSLIPIPLSLYANLGLVYGYRLSLSQYDYVGFGYGQGLKTNRQFSEVLPWHSNTALVSPGSHICLFLQRVAPVSSTPDVDQV